MKSYEEMAQNALHRIGDYETEQKRRKKAVAKIAAPVAGFCLAALLGIGAWQSGLFQAEAPLVDAGDLYGNNSSSGQTAPVHSDEGSGQENTGLNSTENNGTAGNRNTGTDEKTGMPIITGGDGGTKGDEAGTVNDCCIFCWKNKLSMYGDLYWAIENNPDGVYAVLATYRPTTANITSFTYEGKTLAELAIEADNERILPDKMMQLLKQGDELKYGTALYKTGLPSGIKWDQTMYENTVAYLGEELLNKYIVDGEFLREALEKDIAALPSIRMTTPDGTMTCIGETKAREKYAKAYNAYLETVLPTAAAQLTANGIPCERAAYRNNGLTLLVTAEQLQNLPLEDPEYWLFSLAPDDSVKGVSDDVTDATGFKVFN